MLDEKSRNQMNNISQKKLISNWVHINIKDNYFSQTDSLTFILWENNRISVLHPNMHFLNSWLNLPHVMTEYLCG